MNSFGDYLRSARRKAGFPRQIQLSKASGISQATISRLEDDAQQPTEETMEALSRSLKVPINELMLAAGYLDNNAGLGGLLKQLRGNMTLREAAELTGLSHTYIADLENETRRGTNMELKPSCETLKKLSQAYNCPYEKLMQAVGYLDPIELKSTNGYLESECNRLLKENAKLHEANHNLKEAIKNLTKGW